MSSRTQPAPPPAARSSAAGHGRNPRRNGVDGQPAAAGGHAGRDQGGGQRGAEADVERHQPGPRLGVWRRQEEVDNETGRAGRGGVEESQETALGIYESGRGEERLAHNSVTFYQHH